MMDLWFFNHTKIINSELIRHGLYEEIPKAKEDLPPEKQLPPIPAFERYACISKTAREVRRDRYNAKLQKLVSWDPWCSLSWTGTVHHNLSEDPSVTHIFADTRRCVGSLVAREPRIIDTADTLLCWDSDSESLLLFSFSLFILLDRPIYK